MLAVKQSVMSKIEIIQEHIKEAEIYLLGKGSFFETKERVPFITNLETCDLLAVPGSGKTTALLAKLYCLEKHLPFGDGSGILVLSHTNSTIDEIRNKLLPLCPTLSEYPNFIGTIQNFINKFLAIPYFTGINKTKPYRVDADKYYSELKRKLAPYKSGDMFYVLKKYPDIFYKARFKLDENENHYLVKEFEETKLDFTKPKNWTEKQKQAILNRVNEIKIELLREGYLHYDDCYFLAAKHIKKYPFVKQILQDRFSYVFVDEMQDLDKHQIGIIDDIFVTENSKTVIQRIGDKNQAIYNSGKKVKVECEWKTRNELFITGSNRLTKEVAEIVDSFVLDRQPSYYKVNGLRKLKEIIPPHLILFNWDNKDKLLSKFKEIIKGAQDLGHIPKIPKDPFKVIAWSGEWKEEEREDKIKKKQIRLENICNYSKEQNSKKEDFDSLSKYLQLFDRERKTLESIRKSILNALIHILKLNGEKYPTTWKGKYIERYYSKSSFIEFVQKSEKNIYEQFKQDLYCWCIDIIQERYKEVFDSMNNFIKTELKDWFNISFCQDSISFIGTFQKIEQHDEIKGDKDEIKIDVGTYPTGQVHLAAFSKWI